MSKDKTPGDYFPLSNDDIIISEHAQRLFEQERQFIQKMQPMEKLEQKFIENAPLADFCTRVNGACQLSIYRVNSNRKANVCIILSARILSPCMGDSKNAKPEISIRFSIQVNDTRFYFARLAAVKTPDGSTSCAVCAIRSNSDSEYYFEDKSGKVYTGSELDIPITADDLMVATRLNKHDLIASVRLASKILATNDVDMYDTLKHLQKCMESFDF